VIFRLARIAYVAYQSYTKKKTAEHNRDHLPAGKYHTYEEVFQFSYSKGEEKMKRFILTVALALICGMGCYITPIDAYAIPIDLNDFFLDGDGSIASDGSSATLEVQDPDYGYTLLVNDPLWEDPGIGVGADALSLSFGYYFSETTGNDTELYVRLLDGHAGDLIADFGVGETSTGIHSFDLAALLSGQTLLGLDFTITEYEFDPDTGAYSTGSWVIIRDLDLAHRTPAPIPEPATLLLLGTGLVALGGRMRKKYRR
jgi:hypothetical protein